MSIRAFGLATLMMLPLVGGELPVGTTAKLLQMISKGAGEGGRVACQAEPLVSELKKLGAEVASTAKVAWAGSPVEAKILLAQGRLVVCGDMNSFRQGGALALVEEEGKPRMLLNPRNAARSGVTLSDAILKASINQ